MAKTVKMNVDKDLRCLAGFEYGKHLWLQNVDKEYDGTEVIEVVFPEYIEALAVSFVQGFYTRPFNLVGKEKAIETIKIVHSDSEFIDAFLSRIE